MKNHLSIPASILATCIILILLTSCTEEECEDPTEKTRYFISDETLEFTKSYNDITKVIFETNNSQEVTFDVSKLVQEFEFVQREPCDSDPSQSVIRDATVESIDILLSNESLFPKPFVVRLAEENLYDPNNDQILVVSYDYFTPVFDVGNTLLYYNLNNDNPNMYLEDSLVINESTFYSVLQVNNDIVPLLTYEVKYTKAEGIVYIKNNTTGEEYHYLRKE